MLAAEHGQLAVVQVLARNGARLDGRDKKGETAHGIASRKNRHDVAAYLELALAFQRARQADSLAALEQFLAEFSGSRSEEVRAAGEALDRGLWAEAERQDRGGSYAAYLARLPKGAFAVQARLRAREMESVLAPLNPQEIALLVGLISEVARPYTVAGLAAELMKQRSDRRAGFSMNIQSRPDVEKFGTRVAVESGALAGIRAQVQNRPRGCSPRPEGCLGTYLVFQDPGSSANQTMPFRRVNVVFQDVALGAAVSAASVLRPGQLEGKSVVMGQFVYRNERWFRIESEPESK